MTIGALSRPLVALFVAGAALCAGPSGGGTKPVLSLSVPSAQAESADTAGAPGGSAHAADSARRRLGNPKYVAPLFWLFALLVVGGSLFVVTRRNLIAAVMGMVGTFFAVAALYLMLYAHFLAAIQVLVYAGAIMVLFVFVVMILNRPVEEAWARQGLLGNGLAIAGSLYLLFRLASVLWVAEQPANASVFNAQMAPGGAEALLHEWTRQTEPAAELAGGSAYALPRVGAAHLENLRALDFGSTHAVGHTLFSKYLFPFEAVSIVLLVAVVGAIAVARPHRRREGAGEPPPDENAA